VAKRGCIHLIKKPTRRPSLTGKGTPQKALRTLSIARHDQESILVKIKDAQSMGKRSGKIATQARTQDYLNILYGASGIVSISAQRRLLPTSERQATRYQPERQHTQHHSSQQQFTFKMTVLDTFGLILMKVPMQLADTLTPFSGFDPSPCCLCQRLVNLAPFPLPSYPLSQASYRIKWQSRGFRAGSWQHNKQKSKEWIYQCSR
jgi:hypothetical protein